MGPFEEVDAEPQLLKGTVARVGNRYGFIECPEVTVQYADDVFCPGQMLQGCSVGETVEFELVLNDAGKPQANSVSVRRRAGDRGRAAPPAPGQTQGTKFGTIKAIAGRNAFIDCPPVWASHGADVFCPSQALGGLGVGDCVDFELAFNQKGQPQARNARPKGQGKGGGGPPSAGSRGGKGGGYEGKGGSAKYGTINWVGSKFGFIDCPPVMAEHGLDTFAPARLLVGLSVGDVVDFELGFNEKGQPQATNIRPRGAGGALAVAVRASAPPAGKAAGKGGPPKFGTVNSIGSKFGFIDCPPVKAEHGLDTFVPALALQGFSVGDVVDFDLVFNEKGQPQAANVRPHGGGGLKRKAAWL